MRGERSKLCEKITRFKDAAALDAGTFNRSTRKLPRYGTTFVQRRTETLQRTIIDQETTKKKGGDGLRSTDCAVRCVYVSGAAGAEKQ